MSCPSKKSSCPPMPKSVCPTADPCAPKEDPCAPKEDPCAPKEDPCAPKQDPCANAKEDRCPKDSNSNNIQDFIKCEPMIPVRCAEEAVRLALECGCKQKDEASSTGCEEAPKEEDQSGCGCGSSK